MTKKEAKEFMTKKEMRKYKKFHFVNKDKECELCGCGIGEVALFEVHQIMDSKMVYDGEELLLCHNCMTGKDFIEFWSVMVRTKPDIDEGLRIE